MTTVADLLTKTLKRLSMVSGPGVQQYSEDTILQFLEDAYFTLLEQEWWPTLTLWAEVNLDGSTGKPTTDLTVATRRLDRLEDIRCIKREPDFRSGSIPYIPLNVVPSELTGTTPCYFEYDPERVFRIAPYTSTGSVFVNYRTRPVSIDLDTVVTLDDRLLVYTAAYEYLADDGTNPTATNKMAALVNERENKVRRLLAEAPLPTNNWDTSPLTTWTSS